MRVLFVAPYVPSRLRPRSVHFIGELIQRGHSVSLYAVGSERHDYASVGELRAAGVEVRLFGVSRLRSLANSTMAIRNGLPFQAVVSSSAELCRAVAGAADEGFDVLHVEHLRAALAVPEGLPIPTVFDSVDSISRLWEVAGRHAPQTLAAALGRLDLDRTRRFEAVLTRRFSRVMVSSPVDRDHLVDLSGADDGSVRVLPNGVDTDRFHPSAGEREPATVIFVGRMSYHANVAAARRLLEKIAPLIWRERPEARIRIVGDRPTRALRALARSLRPRVELTGYVPEVGHFLANATVAVAPMIYAVGIQNKILEAMATATPVVCSPAALSGIAAVADRDLLSGESDREIAQHVLRVLADPETRRTIGESGRQYVRAHHRWQAIGDGLEALYMELVGDSRAGAG